MTLKLLSTGVPGLDEVLCGGLPEYSFNLVAGVPGAGKTTLVHQVTFANASVERPAIYFTVLGEPSLKMLRYQHEMGFFDDEKVGTSIQFIDLSAVVLEGDSEKLLATIVSHVEETNPAIIVVDSFRTVLLSNVRGREGYDLELQGFLQRLAIHLTSWQVTSFLVGEYAEEEMRENPVFTIADSILWLSQSKMRNSIVRKLEIMKMRGRAALPGLHTFRMSAAGIRVFPRSTNRKEGAPRDPHERASLGDPGFDALTGGGLPVGDATLLAGPSGTGKTALSTQFIAAGADVGEPGVIAIFEEHPDDYLQRAVGMGFDLPAMIDAGMLKVIYLRPMDLSSEETLHLIQDAVEAIGARRLVIDSLNGLELALAPNYREDFRESLYRMVGDLTAGGVSMILTVEVTESFDQLRFSPHDVSFLAQNILFFRYVEMEGRLERVVTVVKMRRSVHSRDLLSYDISASGLRIGEPLRNYRGILTGVPTRVVEPGRGLLPGLTDDEGVTLSELLDRAEATAEELASGLAFDLVRVQAALNRLHSLHYAIAVEGEGRVVYRPVGRVLGT